MRAAVRQVDAAVPVYDVRTMAARLDGALTDRRTPMILALTFAGVALLLAAVGLYGVLAYQVAQRSREIGIRMALGASAPGIFQMVLREGALVVGSRRRGRAWPAPGCCVGPCRASSTKWTRWTRAVIGAVAVVLAVVALVACVLPARRAASTDPAVGAHRPLRAGTREHGDRTRDPGRHLAAASGRDTVFGIVSTTEHPAAVEPPMSIDDARALAARVDAAVRRVIIGQHDVVEQVLLTLLAGGHGLLQGVPGLAKTLLVKTLARALRPALQPHPVHARPDARRRARHRSHRGRPRHRPPVGALRPRADLRAGDPRRRDQPHPAAHPGGAARSDAGSAGHRRWRPPSAASRRCSSWPPQNPIEQEGTYPLPEAQLDRFMLNIVMGYPSAAEERTIIATTTSVDEPEVTPVAGAAELLRLRAGWSATSRRPTTWSTTPTRLVRATRPGDEAPLPESVTRWVRWGAGPRAGQALVLAAKARAVVQGRPAVSLDDVRAVAPPVLRHRVLVNFQAVAEGITAERVVQDVLADVPMRR